MATLTGQTIASTYDGLLKLSDNDGLTASVKNIEDGFGVGSPVNISTAILFIKPTSDTSSTPTSGKEFEVVGNSLFTGDVIIDNIQIDGTTIGHTSDTDLLTLASGQLTVAGHISLPDSKELKFGTDADFKIFHNNTNAFIQNFTGNLIIRNDANDKDIELACDDSSGGVTPYITLDGLNGRTNFSVDAQFSDNKKVRLGSSADFQLYHTGSESNILNLTGNLNISNDTTDGNISFKTDDGSDGLSEYMRLDGGTTSIVVSASTGMYFNDNIKARFGTSGDMTVHHNGVDSFLNNLTGHLSIQNSADDKDILFLCDDGSGGTENFIQIDGSEGRTLFNKPIRLNDNVELQVGSSADSKIYHDGGQSTYLQINNGDLYIRNESNADQIYIQATNSSGTISNYLTIDGNTQQTKASKDILYSDNIKALFGTNSDLAIFHDGSNSRINETGTGNLIIQSTNFQLLKDDGGEFIMQGISDAEVSLYFDGSKRFETTSAGVSVTGDLLINTTGGYFEVDVSDNSIKHADNTKAKFGTGNDLEIYHDSSHSYIDEIGTGDLRIRSNSAIALLSNSNENMLVAVVDDAVELYHDNSKKFETTSGGTKVFGDIDISGVMFKSSGDLELKAATTRIKGISTNENLAAFIENGAVELYHDNSKKFETTSTGITVSASAGATGDVLITSDSLALLQLKDLDLNKTYNIEIGRSASAGDLTFRSSTGEKVRFTESGQVGIGQTSPSATLEVAKGSEGDYLIVGGDNSSNGRALVFSSSTATSNGAKHTIRAQSGNGQIAFKTGTTEALLLDSSQNATFAGDVTATSKKFISTSSSSGDYVRLYAGSGTAQWDIYGSGENLRLSENSSGGGIFRVDSGATFAGELNVQAATHSIANIKSGNNDNILFLQAIQSDNARVGTSTNTDLSFFTNSSERIRIENTGLIGINYTTPSAKLHIETGSDEGIRIHRTGTNANFGAIEFRNSDDSATNSRIGYNANELRLEATNTLKCITNSTERLTIDSSGNATFAGHGLFTGSTGDAPSGSGTFVGLTNNYANLQLNGSNGGHIDFSTSGVDYKGRIIYFNSSNSLVFHTNATTALTLNSAQLATFAGSVTITQNSGSLEFSNTGSGHGSITTGSSKDLNIGAASGNVFINNNTTFAGDVSISNANGNLNFTLGNGNIQTTTGSTSLVFGTNSTERMRIHSSGNIGISNTSPSSKIHIGSNSTSGAVDIGLQNDSRHYTIKIDSGSLKIRDESAGSDRVTLASSGKFGIGSNSPSTLLHVGANHTVGSNFASGFSSSNFFVNNGANGGAAVFQQGTASANLAMFGKDSSNTAISFFNSDLATNTSAVGSITTTSSATAFNTSSDYRLKEDLKDFAGIDLVNQIPVYDFKWKLDESRAYGVLAHELQNVLPQAVYGEKDADEMQGVDYSKIVPLLIKSIQELKKEIEILKSK